MAYLHPIQASSELTDYSSDEVERTYRKVFFKLIPFLFFCYIVSYIDRVNISFAKLQFMKDLGFSEAAYGFGAGLFFIGYVLFEVPSNLWMQRVGARLTLLRIMVVWGLVSSAMMFVSTPLQFYSSVRQGHWRTYAPGDSAHGHCLDPPAAFILQLLLHGHFF